VGDKDAMRAFAYDQSSHISTQVDLSRADVCLRHAYDQHVIEGATEAEILEHFENSVEGSESLDLVLFLLDGRLSSETHRLAAEELEELLTNEWVVRYLHQILYAKPLPNAANIEGAIESSRRFGNVHKFLSRLAESQDAISTVRSAWESIPLEATSQEVEKRELSSKDVEGICIRHGLFYEFVTALMSDANPVAVLVWMSKNSSLKQELPSYNRIGNAWIKPLPRGLGLKASPTIANPSLIAALPAVTTDVSHNRNVSSFKQLPKALKAFGSALAQVERISELVASRQDAPAEKMLDELIREQLQYPDGASYAVKSLCNIATQARHSHRRDFAVNSLFRALKLNPTDPVACFQLGTQLRDSELFEEARQAYDKSLEYGDSDDIYRTQTTLSAKAHVLTEQGKYDDAMQEYESIPFYNDNFSIRNAVADLYRKKGNLREAMFRYLELIAADETFHRAFAGKAEIAKRRGDPHRALRIYNSLLKSGKYTIDDDSRTVYQFARCQLFKRVGQFPKAIEIAKLVLDEEPYHLQAKMQLASLLTLTGTPSAALQRSIRDEARNRDRWQVELLEGLALFHQNHPNEARKHLLENIDISQVVVDEQPLAKCAVAMTLINENETIAARNILSNLETSDRNIQDFEVLLKAHSYMVDSHGAKVSVEFPRFRRVSAEIRAAAESLRIGNLREAFNHELAFMLLAA